MCVWLSRCFCCATQVFDGDGSAEQPVVLRVEYLDAAGGVRSTEVLDATNVNGTVYTVTWTWIPTQREVTLIREWNVAV